MIARRTIISGSAGSIFAIFSPNESDLGSNDRSGPPFSISQRTLPCPKLSYLRCRWQWRHHARKKTRWNRRSAEFNASTSSAVWPSSLPLSSSPTMQPCWPVPPNPTIQARRRQLLKTHTLRLQIILTGDTQPKTSPITVAPYDPGIPEHTLLILLTLQKPRNETFWQAGDVAGW